MSILTAGIFEISKVMIHIKVSVKYFLNEKILRIFALATELSEEYLILANANAAYTAGRM